MLAAVRRAAKSRLDSALSITESNNFACASESHAARPSRIAEVDSPRQSKAIQQQQKAAADAVIIKLLHEYRRL